MHRTGLYNNKKTKTCWNGMKKIPSCRVSKQVFGLGMEPGVFDGTYNPFSETVFCQEIRQKESGWSIRNPIV